MSQGEHEKACSALIFRIYCLSRGTDGRESCFILSVLKFISHGYGKNSLMFAKTLSLFLRAVNSVNVFLLRFQSFWYIFVSFNTITLTIFM